MARRWSAVAVFALCGAVQCIAERAKLSRAHAEESRIRGTMKVSGPDERIHIIYPRRRIFRVMATQSKIFQGMELPGSSGRESMAGELA